MSHNLSLLVFGIPLQKRKGIPSGFEEMPFCFFILGSRPYATVTLTAEGPLGPC